MSMPEGLPIIDTMIGFPVQDFDAEYEILRRGTKDVASKEQMDFPVEYMFKDVPKQDSTTEDPVAMTLSQMDRFGIANGVIDSLLPGFARALREHHDRFIGRSFIDPNDGVDAVRKIVREHEKFGTRAVMVFPPSTLPQLPSNDKKMYPIYTKCVELGLSIWVTAGVTGPRVPTLCQHVELID